MLDYQSGDGWKLEKRRVRMSLNSEVREYCTLEEQKVKIRLDSLGSYRNFV